MKYDIEITYICGWDKGIVTGESGGMVIGRSCELGLGEMSVYKNLGGNLICDSERMSQEFCEEVLQTLASKWTLEH